MPTSHRRPAVFLDRDGVIIENRADYVKAISEACFIPGALQALAQLARSDYRIVIVTNQSAIGRGLVPWHVSEAINHHVIRRIQLAGGRIDGLYLCPHVPGAGCACRKPAPGLLFNAAAALGIDLAASVMIGDALTDVLAASAAGTRAVLVRTGLGDHEAARLAHAGLAGVPIVADLPAALNQLRTGLA